MKKIILILILSVSLCGCSTKYKEVKECPKIEPPKISKIELLDLYYQRWFICFSYNIKSGDYDWRKKSCLDAEKEYLELLKSFEEYISE